MGIKILLRWRSLRRSSENSLKWMIRLNPLTVQDLGTPTPIGGLAYAFYGGMPEEIETKVLDLLSEEIRALPGRIY
jgi:hypothetical protein